MVQTVAPPADEVQGRHDAALRPCLFVGSGGTGYRILLQLKALFVQRHGQVPPWVRLLAFDADEEPLAVQPEGRLVTLERDTEFHYIGNIDTAGIIQHIDRHPGIQAQLPQIRRLPPITVQTGTGQLRPLGSLALYWHSDRVVDALRQALQSLAHRGRLGFVGGTRVDPTRGLNVFVVGSLCGGTGSGQFLHLAYIIRSLLEQMGPLATLSEIIGVGILPDAFEGVDGPRLVPNTVAALHELDHCMLRGDFQAVYRNGYRVKTVRPPFNMFLLLGAVAQAGQVFQNRDELCAMAASGLYHLAMTPIGRQQQSILANHVGVLSRQTNDGHGTFFGSFGLEELHFPAAEVAAWCTTRHARAVIERLLAPPDEEAVEKARQTAAQAHIPDLEGLLRILARDDTGMPLTIELPIPAYIEEAEPEDVPRLAKEYVEAFRRERVEGDFRIWTEQHARRLREEMVRSLAAQLREMVDDLSNRGLWFAQAVAKGLEQHLQNLAAAIEDRREKWKDEVKTREERWDQAYQWVQAKGKGGHLRNIVHKIWPDQKPLAAYFDAAKEYFEARLEFLLLDEALKVITAAQQEVSSWANELASVISHLKAIDEELKRRQQQLQEAILRPARSSGLALVDEAYLERLYHDHAPEVGTTLVALREDETHAPHRWMDSPQKALRELLVRAAARPFEAIRKMTIEEAIQARRENLSPQQWPALLLQKACPAWNLDPVLLPDGMRLARIELLGVPDAQASIYAGQGHRLVSTHDPHRLTAFVMVVGAPFTALRSYERYLEEYDGFRDRELIHVLPSFQVAQNDAKLAFALGSIFGFITANRGGHFYYHPADGLTPRVHLGQGREQAIRALGERPGTEPGRGESLAREVMRRVEERIAEIGLEQAKGKLEAFHKDNTSDDGLTQELKRRVREFADRLDKRWKR